MSILMTEDSRKSNENMSQWSSSDSGILRKNRADENFDQLLVFGYSCKIFRDDEKALYIDQGKHLIPWMGDDSLKIDRYDCRGPLSDVKKYEASREGYDALRWLGLNESEKKLEELCDSERYYSLEINEEEEEMYKEEVAKRQKTNTFAFDYNNPQPQEPEVKEGIPTVPEKEEEDEPYKPSPALDVPVDINIPKTVKEYARIEKTALFVCRQGPQMEILIKAKQADNPQFSFLMVQDPLYKFYRHVLSAFKNRRHQPLIDKKPEEPPPAASQEDQDSHYLHPSLVSSSAKSEEPSLPTVPYRPTADCAYSQLVNRIQGAGLTGQSGVAQQQQGVVPSQMQIINQMNLEQQYHQYYYVQQFYEYWRHTVINSEQGAAYAGLPLNFSQLDPNMQSYIHQLAWAQFVQHHQKQMQEAQQAQASPNNNSYAQIVSNLNKDGVNPYTAKVPQLPPMELSKEEPKAAPATIKSTEERTVCLVKSGDNEVKKPLLSLAAAYLSGSDSESENSDSQESEKEPEEQIEVYRAPSGEVQTVIDKMAEYVSKNGEQFEEIIRQKGDPRFDFLKEGHEFSKYYRAKLRELRGEPEENRAKKAEKTKASKAKSKKNIAPVCFSIKKPKEEAPKEIKSALPMEDSSEEEEGQPDNAPKSPTAQKKTIHKMSQPVLVSLPQPKMAQVTDVKEVSTSNGVSSDKPRSPPHSSRRSGTPRKRSRSPVPPKTLNSRSKTPETKASPSHKSSPEKPKKKCPPIDMFDVSESPVKTKTENGDLGTDDPILEMMELERDEKTEADAKERTRQLERKRKAAMFLKLKSGDSKADGSTKISSPSSVNSRRNSEDSVVSVRSSSGAREKLTPKESRSKSKERSRSARRSRSRESKKRKKHGQDRDRSRTRDEDDRRRRRDQRRKSHKRKHSKSKKKCKKHRRFRSLSRSRSKSRSQRSRSRSSSVKSHISIDDSS